MLPFVSLFALFNSLVCVIVLSNKRLKGVMFQHMLLDSIFSSVYSLSNSFTFIIRCGIFCPYGYAYYSKFYEIYFYIYIAKSVELFILLLDVNMSLIRLGSFSAKRNEQRMSDWAIRTRFVGFLAISFLVCIPVFILFRTIVPIGYLVTQNANRTLNDSFNGINQTQVTLYAVGK